MKVTRTVWMRGKDGDNIKVLPIHIVYEEVVNFIAAGTTPSTVIDFQPSELVKARVTELIQREKNAEISPEEKTELERYIQLEHIMRLAKARAHQYVING